MADKKGGYWFSLKNGKHIHVNEGETPKEATERTIETFEKNGKFYREMDNGEVRVASTREELYEEPKTPEQLKEEFNDLLKKGLSEQEAVKKMLDEYDIPEDEISELFGVEMPFDDDYDFDNWDDKKEKEWQRLQDMLKEDEEQWANRDIRDDDEWTDKKEKEWQRLQDMLKEDEEQWANRDYDNDEESWDDEEDEEIDPIEEMINDGVDLTDKQEVLEYLGATLGLDREDQQAILRKLRSSQKNSKLKGTVVSSRRKPGANDYQLSVDPDKAVKAINSDHKRANYYIDFLYDDFSENINNKDLDKNNTIKYWKSILSKIDDSKIQSDDKLRLMKAALDYGK